MEADVLTLKIHPLTMMMTALRYSVITVCDQEIQLVADVV
jgi:hypothetical protein